jgi:transcriptional regulator
MYIPSLYKNENPAEVEAFLLENAFGILINQTNGKPWGTHIPLLLETNTAGEKIFTGHISLENPQAKNLKNNDEVLCIFSGPHAYISSSWYDHENVPTWNYIAVHTYGTIKIHNLDETIFGLKKLVDKYEKTSKNPVKIEDLSKKTMLQARGILGFEIKITAIEAKKKLSQNRDGKNFDNIIFELEQTNKQQNIDLAAEMKKCPIKMV